MLIHVQVTIGNMLNIGAASGADLSGPVSLVIPSELDAPRFSYFFGSSGFFTETRRQALALGPNARNTTRGSTHAEKEKSIHLPCDDAESGLW